MLCSSAIELLNHDSAAAARRCRTIVSELSEAIRQFKLDLPISPNTPNSFNKTMSAINLLDDVDKVLRYLLDVHAIRKSRWRSGDDSDVDEYLKDLAESFRRIAEMIGR